MKITDEAREYAKKIGRTKQAYRQAVSRKIKPNSKCPCGSGKKWKRCCMKR